MNPTNTTDNNESEEPFDDNGNVSRNILDNVLESVVETAYPADSFPTTTEPSSKQKFVASTKNIVHVGRALSHVEEPVTVAIDVTEVSFGASGETKLGLISSVGTSRPILLGLEPISNLEDDRHSKSPGKARLVRSLIEQASRYVEIGTVLADREFHVSGVIAHLESKDLSYTIPARALQEVKQATLVAQDQGSPPFVTAEIDKNGGEHTYTTNLVLERTNSSDNDYVAFLTSETPAAENLPEVANRYEKRWQIEQLARKLQTRLAKDYRPTLYEAQNYWRAVIDVNAYTLTHLLLSEQLGEQDHYFLGFDELFRGLNFHRAIRDTSNSESGTTDTHPPADADPDEVVQDLARQTVELCQDYDDLTHIISKLDIEAAWFTGYEQESRAKYDLEAIVALLLLQRVGKISTHEVLHYLKSRDDEVAPFGLQSLPAQQTLSYHWRKRLSQADRFLIERAATRIRSIYIEHLEQR